MIFIGNERQLADNDIAIVDARPLSECWSQLSERVESTLVLPDDLPGSAEQQRRTRAVIAREQAARKLRSAISDGQLRIWRVHGTQPVPITPRELLLQNIKTGVFKTYDRPTHDKNGMPEPPEMQGALLWVKESDWRRFQTRLLGSKGGRPPETDWDSMKELAENALSAHPDISRSKLADSLVAEYIEKVSAKAPVKRTIERKLSEWNLGVTKPVSS
ncbi:MAG: hypothetical protein KDJ66_13715 [Nitratireductor sp.]|nr:hypothetical protein [Nitratireductor sp.]